MRPLTPSEHECPRDGFDHSRRVSLTIQRPNAFGRRVLSLPPEVLEPVRRQRRIDRGTRDRPVPQPPLDRPGVVALVGERDRGPSFRSDQPTVSHSRRDTIGSCRVGAAPQLRQPQPSLGLGSMEPLDARIGGAQSEPDGFERSAAEPRRLGMFFHLTRFCPHGSYLSHGQRSYHHTASRAQIIAGLSGFLTLSQSRDGPGR
jgi:hypothetical protein